MVKKKKDTKQQREEKKPNRMDSLSENPFRLDDRNEKAGKEKGDEEKKMYEQLTLGLVDRTRCAAA